MKRKSLGFIPLIWECAFCNTQNPGPIKSCTGCGAPQPGDVEFLQVDEERFNFIKDEALIRMAKAGPDIHCPFCGTRNLSTAELCKKCGGELGMGGKARQAGGRVRTVTEAQRRTPAAAEEPEPKKRMRPIIAIGILALIIACIIGVITLFTRTNDVSATVTGVEWERSIAIEAYTTYTDSDWRDEVPQGASIRKCTMEFRYTASEPAPNATEVCGEPYTEDTGTGVGEVVQDCEYQVYDDYCEFTAMGWRKSESVTESGSDLMPFWPSLSLDSDQREGEREESYQIFFTGDGENFTYTTTDEELFTRAQPGTRWTLKINSLGGVQGLEPSN